MNVQDEKPLVVGLGEWLWDCFPGQRRAGGATANVAYHAGQLGLNGVICSRIGADDLGEELLKFAAEQGLSTQYVQRDARHETGRVMVDDSDADSPRYTILENAAWDFLETTPQLTELAENCDAVCFGSLAQRSPQSRQAIKDFVSAASPDCLVVFDVNLRPPYGTAEVVRSSLAFANILKLNETEVEKIAAMLDLPAETTNFVGEACMRYNLGMVCVTRGENGCLLAKKDLIVKEPGVKIEAADAVGAGDSFSAALIYAQLAGWPLEQTARLANRVAALVAGCRGAMPRLRSEFSQLIEEIG